MVKYTHHVPFAFTIASSCNFHFFSIQLYSINVNKPVLVVGRKFVTITASEMKSIFSLDSSAIERNDTAAISCQFTNAYTK